MMKYMILLLAIINQVISYSALEDGKIIREFIAEQNNDPDKYAKITRELVHNANWGAAGTISTNSDIVGFPMVNIISIADSGKNNQSTGVIYFMLTMLDFTGQDIEKNNKITFMISAEENLECSKLNTDPMEPTCARAHITGKVIEMNEDMTDYNFGISSFINRHPAAVRWLKAHNFKLYKLDIENIFLLNAYGGPHNIKVEDYYNATLEGNESEIEGKWSKILTNLNGIETETSQEELTLKIPKHKYRKISLKF